MSYPRYSFLSTVRRILKVLGIPSYTHRIEIDNYLDIDNSQPQAMIYESRGRSRHAKTTPDTFAPTDHFPHSQHRGHSPDHLYSPLPVLLLLFVVLFILYKFSKYSQKALLTFVAGLGLFLAMIVQSCLQFCSNGGFRLKPLL